MIANSSASQNWRKEKHFTFVTDFLKTVKAVVLTAIAKY
jgi:hypothetical protein